MKAKLTKRAVEGVLPAANDVFLWDTELHGFGVKITPKGARVYIFQYWYGGRSRRYTLGRHGESMTRSSTSRWSAPESGRWGVRSRARC